MRTPSTFACLLLAAAFGLGTSAARAQEWPARPIKLVVPFSPGGTADTLGRVFAQALSEGLGQQVYVDNRGGAGGMSASAQVARSARSLTSCLPTCSWC